MIATTAIDGWRGITLRLVECQCPLRSQFRIFNLLHPLVAYLSQPAFEGLSLGRRDGLNDAEDALSVGTVHLLFAA
jgi:hypothetical protein